MRINFWKGVAAFALIALVVIGFTTQDLYRSQGDINRTLAAQSNIRANQIRNSQIQNCELVGEPVRKATIKKSHIDADALREEIAQSKQQEASGLLAALFPGQTDAQLHALLEKDRHEKAKHASDLEDIATNLSKTPPCDQRYPPLIQLTP